MKQRTISAIIALFVFTPFILLGAGYFAFSMWFLAMISLYEIARMKKLAYWNLIGVISSMALTVVVLPTKYNPLITQAVDFQYVFYLFVMALLIATVYEYRSFNFEAAAVLIFSVLYIGFGFRFLIMIRDMGLNTLMFFFIVIWSTDIGAYLVGRKYGKHKLAPEVSPNKTIEGSIGGVLLAMCIGSLYVRIFHPNLEETYHVWLLSMLISCVGQLGDLVESALKRFYGVKDSGHFLPGHGGVLDRFDSLIFASFIFMIWLNLFR